jgi:DNA (cytosine-5)-methyltransferase 1
LENVPNILAHKYFGRILADLAESGYDARWKVISAGELGAIHRRDRLWIVAHSNGERGTGRSEMESRQEEDGAAIKGRIEDKTPDYWSERRERVIEETLQMFTGFSWCKDIRRIEDLRNRPDISEPLLYRTDNGLANRVDRLKAIGNGQVPIVFKTAWNILTHQP